MTTGELRPEEATDPAGFVDLLRRLKDRSGLTYRQLEQRAAAAGDVLARSTAADLLRRSTLPRPEVLAAFVRACGAQDQVERWLRARDRLAAGPYAGPELISTTSVPEDLPPAGAGPGEDGFVTQPVRPARSGWFARPASTLLLVGTLLAALVLGAWFWWPDDEQRTATEQIGAVTSPGSGSSAAPSGGRSQLRPARAPHLCLTEGRDRTGRYPHEVAAQRPCAEATPPDTYLEPVADDLYFIKWHHPVHGPGCLTVRREDPGRNLIEPWPHCRTDFWPQLFRFEPTGAAPTEYRLRPAGSDLCVGIRDDHTEVPAEAAAEPCTGGVDQVFLVDSLPED
ncbi:helix-turn-helix transcriptional regulator [Micromonospora sp. NBC_01739]|uniref:helix-turn-helix transcriptional regulator n=1 Tax=Micromonospora sp. NBC_01739 TaxID=2975985 RepID=UPI002E0DCC1A|nr:helix-turn-helix domain-containing protein [Micromonospora sp. NBC_01739]